MVKEKENDSILKLTWFYIYIVAISGATKIMVNRLLVDALKVLDEEGKKDGIIYPNHLKEAFRRKGKQP